MNFNFDIFLEKQKEKNYFKNLISKLEKIGYENIFPKKEEIFFAYQNFDFNNLKIIIIGQDPYPTKGVANGLAFSTSRTNLKTPASLKNIFKEIKNSYPKSQFLTNDLSYWKNQGVLLINNILTVEESLPLAHKNMGWENFTYEFLKKITKTTKNIIFLVMGNYALNVLKKIDLNNHFVYIVSHPSPLSCNKNFLGSDVFKKINNKLRELNKKEIDWNTK
ncbi:uracil-DNA glycosylase [Metamycoplasma phocicerebrale]|uniref:Uracil-DNA glycosylase n=1 Tax=Metamycoplasma phocicerebrale TaxID=142649 RepID=A0A3T0TUG3_9BACT|nr:uracil-DNA glycosylase [Metamycoplasma phocicerebrale]AZZ65680.1 uracil-DNA glycosylase [Metamycoplasma phocicerebrale]